MFGANPAVYIRIVRFAAHTDPWTLYQTLITNTRTVSPHIYIYIYIYIGTSHVMLRESAVPSLEMQFDCAHR